MRLTESILNNLKEYSQSDYDNYDTEVLSALKGANASEIYRYGFKDFLMETLSGEDYSNLCDYAMEANSVNDVNWALKELIKIFTKRVNDSRKTFTFNDLYSTIKKSINTKYAEVSKDNFHDIDVTPKYSADTEKKLSDIDDLDNSYRGIIKGEPSIDTYRLRKPTLKFRINLYVNDEGSKASTCDVVNIYHNSKDPTLKGFFTKNGIPVENGLELSTLREVEDFFNNIDFEKTAEEYEKYIVDTADSYIDRYNRLISTQNKRNATISSKQVQDKRTNLSAVFSKEK